MARQRTGWTLWAGLIAVGGGLFAASGCYSTLVDNSEYARGPAPLRTPAPGRAQADCCYEDSLTGGHVFSMYCASCHDARSLAERPFASYKNAAAHMRRVANLTGKEYAELTAWMRRWHDVPPPGQIEAPSPKRFFFSQPIPELRDQKAAADLVAGPRAGANAEVSPGQPPPGNSPREAR